MKQLTTDNLQLVNNKHFFDVRKSAISCQWLVVSSSASRPRGFTLVETLIAISILLVSVVGPIGLIGDATHKIYFAKDEMIALNLAQEGVETVRKIRDSNMLAGILPWSTGFSDGGYVVDVINANPLIPCAGSCDQKVYIDVVENVYRQGIGAATPTQFERLITTSSVGLPANEMKVTSVVTWKTGGQNGAISVSENLFNWVP